MMRGEGISILWTKNLKEKHEKEEFTALIKTSRRQLDRINEIIEEKEKEIISAMKKDENFVYGAWAEHHAMLIGELKGLSFIKELLGEQDEF